MPVKKIKKFLETKKIHEPFFKIAFSMILLLFLILLFSIIRRSFFGEVEAEKHIYFEILFLLVLAILAEAAVFYFKFQSVIVLMLLGMLISPSSMEILWEGLAYLKLPLPSSPPALILHPDIINVFAQFGAIILLFKVGLHGKIEKIFSKENLFVAIGGILIPFITGYFYASLFSKGDFAYSMFIGAALAATSVGVTVAVLKEMKVLSEKFSEVIIGAAIIDDILGLLLLSFVINITESSGNALSPLLVTFFTAAIFIAGSLISSKYFLAYFDKGELEKRRFILAMAYMIFLSYVAEIINLSAIVGAFISGIILSKSRHLQNLEEKTFALEFLFMPIFFISLGILVDVRAILLFLIPIIIITLIAVFSKIIGCGAVALISKMSLKESLLVGIGMVPRGEVALIIASLGLSKGVLQANEYTVISAMALLTSFLVPSILSFMLRKMKYTNE